MLLARQLLSLISGVGLLMPLVMLQSLLVLSCGVCRCTGICTLALFVVVVVVDEFVVVAIIIVTIGIGGIGSVVIVGVDGVREVIVSEFLVAMTGGL